jgi:hypothetical protein
VTTPNERERQLEDWLRAGAPAAGEGAPITDQCLDAETAAAWIDGGLSASAVERVQAHVADCVRCQTLVASLAGAVDDRAASTAPVPDASRRARAPWILPLAAAAIILVSVGLFLFNSHSASAPATMASVESPQTGPDVRVPEPIEPAPSQAAEPSASGSVSARASAADPRAKAELSKQPDSAKRRTPAIAAQSASDQGQVTAESDSPAAAPAPAAAPPPARRSSPGEVAETSAADAQPQRDAGRPGGIAASASMAKPAAPAPRQERAAPDGAQSQRSANNASGVVVSPSGTRWRLEGRAVQQSVDGGATWRQVATAAADLTSASAPAESVCWVAGRAGTVLMTTDGREWRPVPFPERADLVGVSARDARDATVAAADGRSFRTTDGGQTWSIVAR